MYVLRSKSESRAQITCTVTHSDVVILYAQCCDDARSASYASYSLGTDESMPSHKSMIKVYNLYVPSKFAGA